MLSMFISKPYFEDYEEFITETITKKEGSLFQKHIHKGETLENVHNVIDRTAFYIKKGIAKLSILTEDGNENIIFFIGKGNLYPINWNSYVYSMEQNLSLTALSDMDVIQFSTLTLKNMFDNNVEFANVVIEHTTFYISTLFTKILLSTYTNSIVSVCTFIYLYYNNDDIKPSPLTQNEVAQIIGISRKQLSRILGVLRDEGIIETSRNNIHVLDYNKLENYCSNIISDTQ